MYSTTDHLIFFLRRVNAFRLQLCVKHSVHLSLHKWMCIAKWCIQHNFRGWVLTYISNTARWFLWCALTVERNGKLLWEITSAWTCKQPLQVTAQYPGRAGPKESSFSGAVKRSRNQNNCQNFLTPVAAVTRQCLWEWPPLVSWTLSLLGVWFEARSQMYSTTDHLIFFLRRVNAFRLQLCVKHSVHLSLHKWMCIAKWCIQHNFRGWVLTYISNTARWFLWCALTVERNGKLLWEITSAWTCKQPLQVTAQYPFSRNEEMGNGKRGNGEMRKWEESTLHFTQQTADILLLQPSSVMRKLMSIQHLLRRLYLYIPYSVHQRDTYATALHIASWSAS